MRHFAGWLAAATLMCSTIAGPAAAQANLQKMVNWCIGKNNPTPAQRISGCTAAINAKKFKGELLASAYQNRGLVYHQLRKFEDAERDALAAIRFAPRAPEAHVLHAVALGDMGRMDEAIAAFNKAIALNPRVVLAYYSRAVLYQRNNEPDKALADYDKAISLDPKYLPSYINRSMTYTMLKRHDEALADATTAIGLLPRGAPKPNRALALANRAQVYREMKKYELALKDLNAAIELTPTTQYLRGRFAIYEAAGTPELGLRDTDRMIADDPQDAFAYNMRCWANALTGKLETALADCNKAIALSGGEAAFYDSRGLVHLKMARYDDAISDYDRSLTFQGYQSGGKVSPNLASPLYGRGLARQKKGDTLGSVTDLAQAKLARPEIVEKYERYLNK